MNKNNNKCLYCYENLTKDEIDFHSKCCKSFFNQKTPPEINFGLNEIESFAIKILGKNKTVTGVQPKLSLEEEIVEKNKRRLTIVGLWGYYILKPPVELFPFMPEIEDLTMHMAEILKIETSKHSLIKLKSGELSYLTKRFDRINQEKLHVEDMAQLTGTLTARKYRGSMEKVGKTIEKYSNYSGNDLLKFYELALFSFISGNADMHLKNFSLLRNDDDEIVLSPGYDLLSTKLLIPEDNEELALTLNGKKNRISKKDFQKFSDYLGLNVKAVEKIHDRFKNNADNLFEFINKSFLNEKYKKEFKDLISERLKRI